MAARMTNQSGNPTGLCSSLEKDGGIRDEDDSKPPPVTSCALIGSYPGQDVVKEEATPDQIRSEIPSGWTRTKLEPDC
jgi:hypothetical protein